MATRKKQAKKKAAKKSAKKKAAKKGAKSSSGNHTSKKRVVVSQTDFPQITLDRALRIAQALWNEFAGTSAAPHDIAFAADMAPTSGTWRNLCGSSIAYGLTEGGYNAQEISLTELGKRIVAPEEEDDDVKARADAVQQPRIIRVHSKVQPREVSERRHRGECPGVARNSWRNLWFGRIATDIAEELRHWNLD